MKKIAPKIFLIVFGILLALLVGELYTRRFYPQQVFSDVYPYKFHCFIKGDYYWIKFKSNSDCLLQSNAGAFPEINIKTNSLGLRNPEINPEKKENSLRVLFLGDSYTVGWGVQEKEAFPRISEKYLQELIPDKKVETINAGLTGSGIGYDYLFYKNEGVQLKPDIVVVGFYLYNDIPENSFLSRWITDNDNLPQKIESTFFYVDPNGMFYPIIIPLKHKIPYLRETQLFSLLMDKLPFKDTTSVPVFESKFINPYFCMYKKECHDLDLAKEKVKKLFVALKQMTINNNQKLLIVFQPVEFQINAKTRLNYVPIPLLPSDKDYPYQYFEDFFKENEIDYLDLRPYLKENSEEKLYLSNDDHWNATGHKIAAEAISEKLLKMLTINSD